MGAAIVKQVGNAHLTMIVEESLKVAQLFDKAQIVPLHFEGWEHFTESYTEIENKYKQGGPFTSLAMGGSVNGRK